MPCRSATGLTLGGTSASPRPLTRSGCVTSAATSWPAATSASRLGTANAPLSRKTTRTRLLLPPPPRLLAQLALHQVALQGGEPVDEQQAVDVIDLVAERAGEQLGRL